MLKYQVQVDYEDNKKNSKNPTIMYNKVNQCMFHYDPSLYRHMEYHRYGQLHRLNAPSRISTNGGKRWYRYNKKYKESIKPSVVWYDDRDDDYSKDDYPILTWYKKGKRIIHRTDGPAIIKGDGTKIWYINGKIHRTDGPAIIKGDGTKIWCKDGKLHRENGPAIIYPDNKQEYWLDDLYHRTDGPAIIKEDGTEIWYQYGKLHRENGPAIIYPDGTDAYYINGKRQRVERIRMINN